MSRSDLYSRICVFKDNTKILRKERLRRPMRMEQNKRWKGRANITINFFFPAERDREEFYF